MTAITSAVSAFQSTPSAWRETYSTMTGPQNMWNFNPLPPHGGRLIQVLRSWFPNFISIHSLRMEGDMRTQLTPKRFSISIHSLRMEGDISTTPHVRRPKHFNPLPPHGGRHDAFLKETFYNDFNPLPPHGGRRQGNFLRNDLESISIHSLRMEGDSVRTVQRTAGEYFNPLPPHGGRHTTRPRNDLWWTFQSTPSAWRETCRRISACPVHRYFNPLPPHGGRLNSPWRLASHESFQSTPSAWRETAQSL